jgi:uncharacterized protein (DUF924 family)
VVFSPRVSFRGNPAEVASDAIAVQMTGAPLVDGRDEQHEASTDRRQAIPDLGRDIILSRDEARLG